MAVSKRETPRQESQTSMGCRLLMGLCMERGVYSDTHLTSLPRKMKMQLALVAFLRMMDRMFLSSSEVALMLPMLLVVKAMLLLHKIRRRSEIANAIANWKGAENLS